MNEQTIAGMLAALNPDIVAKLRLAIELGKWPGGERLTREQRETCMQAMLAWELKNLPPHERTGYIDRGTKQDGEVCGDESKHEHQEADERLLKIIQ